MRIHVSIGISLVYRLHSVFEPLANTLRGLEMRIGGRHNATDLQALLDFARNNVPFHRRRGPEEAGVLGAWPLMSREDLGLYSLDKTKDLLSPLGHCGARVFASGGTKGKEKYVCYSHPEFRTVSQNLASGLMANGLEAGDKIVNYFTSGDLWGSFLFADRAMSMLPVTIFPLGHSQKMEYALDIIERFKPNAIVGIPSMILQLARYCNVQGNSVRINKVFYGGEFFTKAGTASLFDRPIMQPPKSVQSAGNVPTATAVSTMLSMIP